jgi:hypothetical protein
MISDLPVLPAPLKGGNQKLGDVATESRPTGPTGPTCPLSCVHHPKHGGDCYSHAADRYHPSVQAGMRDRAEIERRHPRAYWNDRARIWTLWAERGIPLRALVHGDLLDPRSKRIDTRWLSYFVRAVRSSGIRAWLYTHTWRELSERHLALLDSAPRLRVFASCDSEREAAEAARRGFRVALVSDLQSEWKRISQSVGQTLIPCPHQTHGITCRDCRYCYAPGASGGVIFRPH